MDAKIIRVSDKGQIALPTEMRTSADIEKGDEVLILRSGRTLIIQKMTPDDFRDLRQHAEKSLHKLWGSKADEHWDKI